MRLLPGLQPLRHRDYAIYWTGLAISQSGTWMEVTATSWLLYELTASPVLLGLGGLFRAAPLLLLALLGGAVADRLPRRRVAIAAQLLYLASSALLGTLVLTGRIQFWQIYLFSAVNSAVTAFDQPARAALYPALVPRAQLQNAVTLNSTLHRLAQLVGPALAGLVIVAQGLAAPYFWNALSYLASATGLSLLRVRHVPTPSGGSLRAEALSGVRYALASPVLTLVLLMEAIFNVFGHNSALLTIFARDVLAVDAAGLGFMLSAIAAGALCGVAGLIVVGDVRRKGLVMLGAGVAYAAAIALFAWSRAFPLTLLILVGLGVADAAWSAMRTTIAQLTVDDAYRGRVMSLITIAARGLTQLSQLETGVAVALLGPAYAATLSGAVLAASAGVATARAPALRELVSPGPVQPAVAESSD